MSEGNRQSGKDVRKIPYSAFVTIVLAKGASKTVVTKNLSPKSTPLQRKIFYMIVL
jgi:hypothetical protein